MERIVFTPEMLNVLKSLVGKTLISYKFACNHPTVKSSHGRMRVYTDAGCVEFTNFIELKPFLYDELFEVAVFKCEEVDPESTFRPGTIAQIRDIEVGKKITGIEIVSEYNRRIENGFENLFDYGVIIRMGKDSLLIATGCWFDESIDIYEHDDYERVRSLQAQKDCLCQEDEGSVEVKRFQRKL